MCKNYDTSDRNSIMNIMMEKAEFICMFEIGTVTPVICNCELTHETRFKKFNYAYILETETLNLFSRVE